MLLRYLNKGIRSKDNWHTKNFECRGSWEFMAIIEGRAGLLTPENTEAKFLSNRLWMLAPTSQHCWRVKDHESCTVIVMHFASIPAVMENFVADEKAACISIGKREIENIMSIYAEVLPYYRRPRLASVLRFEKAALELCILMESALRLKKEPSGFSRSTLMVHQTTLWYRQHLAEGATVQGVCKSFHISPSQLRRMFEKSLKKSPKQVFATIVLDEACRLMTTTTLSIKEISVRCGYAGFSQFYRAFVRRFKMSPTKWRENSYYGKNLGIKTS